MKALFDTNVVLDVLLDRQPHAGLAVQLFALVDQGRLEGWICATTVTTIHYLAAKAVGRSAAKQHLRNLLALFQVAPVDQAVLDQALALDFMDYEDAVLHEAAGAAGMSVIVTRNASDFAKATLLVVEPAALLASIRDENRLP